MFVQRVVVGWVLGIRWVSAPGRGRALAHNQAHWCMRAACKLWQYSAGFGAAVTRVRRAHARPAGVPRAQMCARAWRVWPLLPATDSAAYVLPGDARRASTG